MDEHKILRAIRLVAWEQAKGYLQATLHALRADEGDSDEYNRAKRLVEDFISSVEDYDD